jgi:hypothetical protein
MATQSLADVILWGKIAVLTAESGPWELISTVDPQAEFQFLGFDRPPIPRD